MRFSKRFPYHEYTGSVRQHAHTEKNAIFKFILFNII